MSGTVYELQDKQRLAVDPQGSVWLSASAGTGKTQVLSARVLRLLLEPGADPAQVLCLTFTKAGAAEMAVRVNAVLARWVRLKSTDLAQELGYLGAPIDPETQARARSLFARVLDCPGGGLRIDTIHAFAQYLLAAFPGEAGILPGSRPMEDRERDLLSREVLSDLLAQGDPRVTGAIAEMSKRKGPDAVRGWLMRCARHMELWEGTGSWQPPMAPRVHRLVGIPADADTAWVAAACSDDEFPTAALRGCLAATREWSAKTGQKAADFIEGWLAEDPEARLLRIDGFFDTLLKKDGSPRKMGGAEKADPSFPDNQERIAEAIGAVRERKALLDLAAFLAPQLEAGRAFSLAWQEAKEREGLVDFDDLIARAATLLSDSTMADWIRYKLDRSFDHILVDEAQDTNEAQWNIVKALTDDYFDGSGAQGDAIRTIFAVGDYKQAIFGFQGTSPENFREARDYFDAKISGAAEAAGSIRGGPRIRPLEKYGLGRSYRTNQEVLGFVDRAIDAVGFGGFGLDTPAEPHTGSGEPGVVGLWQVVRVAEDEDEEDEHEGWLARHDRLLADRIAQQVAAWLDPEGEGFTLSKGRKRRATAGDVMILVQKRRELASLIVARLYRHGVPVAGVDRLRLGNPLAVKDLMAALRFAAQPLDDLTLASLLVSPLVGWSQEELLAHGYRAKGKRLWEHLRESDDPFVAGTVASLREILRRADFDSPQQLLHWMLIGPMDGRRRLVARLGREANDPVDELLNAANAYASAHTASLQGFIRWFDAGDGELKREAGEGGDQVRVMTVHGSKGLEAPIVILADAAIRPDGAGDLVLREDLPGTEAHREIPLPSLGKNEKVGPVALADEAEAAKAMQEHWRLLYVALTRAQEALFITGSLGPRDARNGPHEDSWYARLKPLFGEEEGLADDIWGARWEIGERAQSVSARTEKLAGLELDLPAWATTPIGPEPRPPRPLAPSGLGEVEGSDPPLPPGQASEAARRGTLIHALLERLPQVAPEERSARARTWLARQAPDLGETEREEMLERATVVLTDPGFAAVFGREALAEVPLAATVEGQVVMGTADRLLVTPDKVTVVDFKTARRPPQSLDAIPDSTMKQMAAYVAALEIIYAGRKVEAAILYTQTPQLFALPAARLAAYKSAFAETQESFALPPVE
ncbi:double-strand break repair helicase AddA [Erythrobacter sp.]|uniref:double-strand break repair helicase AddA n=1 Tax=Erythrobacter sp. TaxID=1042 RepID=UPI001B25EF3F|nr:double-strand break repair helicase AddA [Erythrobacter sp.]MBO6526891.1 double-strand break repair helicase AddA [Erythrobacter sp.]MBO6528563.1 double-strand break repair helicase AddA [Erythrobacter sp.]